MENEYLDTGIEKTNAITYASFWDRLWASLLDGLILVIPVFGLATYGNITHNLMIALLALVLGMLYKPLMEGIYGATLGKMIMKIKMVDDNNEQISLAQSFGKNAIYIVSSAIQLLGTFELFSNEDFLDAEGFMEVFQAQQLAQQDSSYSMISLVWAFFVLISVFMMFANSDTKQTLHDKIAKTFCVKKNLF
ncbi:MAG: RDD family protein [Saprospiraceae bacterium]